MSTPEDDARDVVPCSGVPDTESESLGGEVTNGMGVVTVRVTVVARAGGRFARGGRVGMVDVFTLGVFA
mgnify:CR=1 FL=1